MSASNRNTWRWNLQPKALLLSAAFIREQKQRSRLLPRLNEGKPMEVKAGTYQLFDSLTADEFAELKADIQTRGVLVAVELDEDGNILDGHHRVQAWQQLRDEGVDLADYPRMIRPGLSEEQKRNHVRALNLLRRHLQKDQRVRVFADMRADGMSYRQIAEAAGVDPKTVRNDLAGGEYSPPETVTGKDGKSYPAKRPQIGTSGVMASSQAQQEQAQAALRLVDVETGEIFATVEIKREAGKVEQAERKEEKRHEAQTLPPDIYNVIYADPAWEYENTGLNGAAAGHYDTMPIGEIYNLPEQIGLQIADNAVLFLWVTNPFLAQGLECLSRWGFEYKTHLVWVKTELQKPGVGWYVRGRHELLFIATRGSFTPIDEHISPPIGSVITSPIQEHSRKPDEVYDIIERLYPGCNCIELFARRSREGWAAWGNEVAEPT